MDFIVPVVVAVSGEENAFLRMKWKQVVAFTFIFSIIILL